MKRLALLLSSFSLMAAVVCLSASGFCMRHAFSLSGATREDWFELSRLFRFAEAGCWIVVVAVIVRHAVNTRRARLGRAPASARTNRSGREFRERVSGGSATRRSPFRGLGRIRAGRSSFGARPDSLRRPGTPLHADSSRQVPPRLRIDRHRSRRHQPRLHPFLPRQIPDHTRTTGRLPVTPPRRRTNRAPPASNHSCPSRHSRFESSNLSPLTSDL